MFVTCTNTLIILLIFTVFYLISLNKGAGREGGGGVEDMFVTTTLALILFTISFKVSQSSIGAL